MIGVPLGTEWEGEELEGDKMVDSTNRLSSWQDLNPRRLTMCSNKPKIIMKEWKTVAMSGNVDKAANDQKASKRLKSMKSA